MYKSRKLARQKLMGALCRISNARAMESVLSCILSKKELEEVENRLRIFHGLQQGLTHREISDKLKVAIATVTRGASAYRNGEFATLQKYL